MSNIIQPQTQQIDLTDLQGIYQRQDLDKIPDNYSPLHVNIDLSKTGTWVKRQGSAILSGSSRSGGVKGLIEYNDASANDDRRIRMWRGGLVSSKYELDYYNRNTQVYATLDNTQTTIDYISSVNFIGRTYHVSNQNFLSYETGGTLTQVSANIKADCLAVAQNTLFVGNVTVLSSSAVSYQNRVYYSIGDSTNNVPSDTFVNPNDSNVLSSSRFLTFDAPIRGLYPFATGGVGVAMMYIFTKRACYNFNMRNLDNLVGPVEVFNIGLINKNAICNCMGVLVWMDNNGKLWWWNGYYLPVPISWELEDGTNGEAIINQIDKTSRNLFAAGSLNNKFYFSIGTVTYKGTTITNAVIVGNVSQNRQVVVFSVESYPVRPVIFANAEINTNEYLLFGSATTDDVYQMNTGTDDGGIAINAYGRTKHIDFGSPFQNKLFSKIYIKYKPQPIAGTLLTIKYALDNTTTYTTLGTIDMNVGYGANVYIATNWIGCPGSDVYGKNISIEVSNAVTGQRFEVEDIGFEFSTQQKDYRAS